MIQATQKDYDELRKDLDGIKDGKWSGFTKCNFIDYSNELDTIRKEYKGCHIRIEQQRTGIRASKFR